MFEQFFDACRRQNITQVQAELSKDVRHAEELFVKVMDDDFNTPNSLAILFGLVHFGNDDLWNIKKASPIIAGTFNAMRELAGILGIFQGSYPVPTELHPFELREKNFRKRIEEIARESMTELFVKEICADLLEQLKTIEAKTDDSKTMETLINLLNRLKESILAKREEARSRKDFKTADFLRKRIEPIARINDTEMGPIWEWRFS